MGKLADGGGEITGVGSSVFPLHKERIRVVRKLWESKLKKGGKRLSSEV